MYEVKRRITSRVRSKRNLQINMIYNIIHCKDWTQSSNVVVWHNFPPKNKDISEAIWELYQAKGKQEVRLMILRWRNVSVQSTMVNCEMCNCWLRHNLSSGASWTFAQPWLVLGCYQHLHNICTTMVASWLLPTFAQPRLLLGCYQHLHNICTTMVGSWFKPTRTN